MNSTPSTRTLHTDGAQIVYDVHGPLPTADGRPPLLMVGHPMDAGGFGALAAHLEDRTVVTYDPRGLGRSTRSDGLTTHSPTVQAGRSSPWPSSPRTPRTCRPSWRTSLR